MLGGYTASEDEWLTLCPIESMGSQPIGWELCALVTNMLCSLVRTEWLLCSPAELLSSHLLLRNDSRGLECATLCRKPNAILFEFRAVVPESTGMNSGSLEAKEELPRG